MLDNRDPCAQENRVHRPAAVPDVIDVQGVNSDHYCARLTQQLGRAARQERMTLQIGRRGPLGAPNPTDKYRLASNVRLLQECLSNGPALTRGIDDNALQVCELPERQLR